MPLFKIISNSQLGFRSSSCGFTLLEILIAISIVSVISALTIPNLRNFNEEQVLKNDASRLVTVLRQAQSNTQARVNCEPTKESAGWRVNFPSSTTFNLIAICASDLSTRSISSNTTTSNITLAILDADTDSICTTSNSHINFMSSNADPICNSVPVDNLKIQLTNSKTLSIRSITINKAGSINEISGP